MSRVGGYKRFIYLFVSVLCVFALSMPIFANSKQANEHPKFLIKLKAETDTDKFIESNGLNAINLKKVKHTNSLIAELNPNELQSILDDDDIEFIEQDSSVQIAVYGEPNQNHEFYKKIKKDSETIPWGIQDIGGVQALENKIFGKKIKIAVLDTGVSNHPDLKIAGGVSFVDGVSDYSDDNGHGTHVTGTIAALNNKIGVVGAAPEAEIYSVKVLDRSGLGCYSQVIQGVDWAIENGMDIISMSFGGFVDSKVLHEVIQEATNKGILVIAAAGNMGEGEETELYPALYPEVISVGAVDSTHNRANFSSTGSEIDLVAPGVDILSTSVGSYGVLSGTSMAVPHVTGAAAALWSSERGLTNQEIKNKLFETATPLGDSHEYGCGLVNLVRALGLDSEVINTPVNPPPGEPVKSSFINQKDVQLLALSKKLLRLKEYALEKDNIPLAKQLEQKYNDLIIVNLELHQLPVELSTVSKEVYMPKEAEIEDYYKNKESD